MSTELAGPRLVARAGGPHAHPNAERAVHVLAQLGDCASLRVVTSGHIDRQALERLAHAYGVESRLSFGGPPGSEDGETPVEAWPRARERTYMAELVHRLDWGAHPHSPPRGDDGLLAGRRIVFITNRPAHYRVALLNRLQDRLTAVGSRLSVLFSAATPWSRSWMRPEGMRFEHHFLRSVRVGLPTDLPVDLERRVLRPRPDIVLTGTFSPLVTSRLAVLCAARRIPLGLVSGEIPWHATAAGWWRRQQRRALMRALSFAITYGHASAEYLRTLTPDLPLVYGRNTTAIPEAPAARPPAARRIEILAVGQAIRRKGFDIVVDAMGQVEGLPCRLTVIGEGDELDALIRRANGRGNVRFTGAVPSDRILEAYRDADMFLFPTRSDVFGLVLVEGMGAGLATISSCAPGAIADLAVPNETCILIDGEDPAEWAQAIRRLVNDPEQRAKLGATARRAVLRRWTLDHETDAWMAGLRLGALSR